MISSRDELLRLLSDGRWYPATELGPTPYQHGIEAWVRLLRLSGFTIEERARRGVIEYRLVPDENGPTWASGPERSPGPSRRD